MATQQHHPNLNNNRKPEEAASQTRPGVPGGSSPQPDSQRVQGGQDPSLSSRIEKTAEQVKNTAIQQAEGARRRAESGISDQRHQLAERIHRVGEMFRTTERDLAQQDEFVSHYVGLAGERVQRVASYVESADLSRIADDARSFARARPALFVGGAFVAGLAIGRFFRASGSHAMGSSGADITRRDDGQGSEQRGTSARGVLP